MFATAKEKKNIKKKHPTHKKMFAIVSEPSKKMREKKKCVRQRKMKRNKNLKLFLCEEKMKQKSSAYRNDLLIFDRRKRKKEKKIVEDRML